MRMRAPRHRAQVGWQGGSIESSGSIVSTTAAPTAVSGSTTWERYTDPMTNRIWWWNPVEDPAVLWIHMS